MNINGIDITTIDKLSKIDLSKYGKQVCNLYKTKFYGLNIEHTLVISNNLFKHYLKNKKKCKQCISGLFSIIKDEFIGFDYIELYPSQKIVLKSIPNYIWFKLNKSAIIENIILLFESWFNESSRSQRIVYSINETDTYPAIYFQPKRKNIHSLVTRCPKTGFLTNNNNIKNVHNSIKNIDGKFNNLLNNLEQCLKRPIKLYFFINNENIFLKNIEYETMTKNAMWTCINNLYTNGIINKEEYIDKMVPEMIYEKSGTQVKNKNNKKNEIISINGINASPGIGIGRLVFRHNNIDMFNKDSIFCCKEASANDLKKISLSSAAISCTGCMVSHLAMYSRNYRIPAVVGASFQIGKNNYLISNKKKFPEFSYVVVDGYKGQIFISNEEIMIENNFRSISSFENLKIAYTLIHEIAIKKSFSSYSLDFQLKVAQLLNAYKKIGFEL